MRNTTNSLTQPTECNKKTSLQFPSALIAPPRVGPAKSRLSAHETTWSPPPQQSSPNALLAFQNKSFISLSKRKLVFSHLDFYSGSSRIFLNYTWPPLICPPSFPIQLSRMTASLESLFQNVFWIQSVLYIFQVQTLSFSQAFLFCTFTWNLLN